jgi:hypothetical protein
MGPQAPLLAPGLVARLQGCFDEAQRSAKPGTWRSSGWGAWSTPWLRKRRRRRRYRCRRQQRRSLRRTPWRRWLCAPCSGSSRAFRASLAAAPGPHGGALQGRRRCCGRRRRGRLCVSGVMMPTPRRPRRRRRRLPVWRHRRRSGAAQQEAERDLPRVSGYQFYLISDISKLNLILKIEL